jgi:hypothetical protein
LVLLRREQIQLYRFREKAKKMKHAVIEKVDDQISVTLHSTSTKAEDWAMKLALDNTSSTEEEIREHFYSMDSHEEGDYGVYLVDAVEKD